MKQDHQPLADRLRPVNLKEFVGQNHLVGKGKIIDTFKLLADTRSERKNLIFHTLLFQIVFIILTIFVLTSSASLFGRGLVLAFYLHLAIDMYVDWKEVGSCYGLRSVSIYGRYAHSAGQYSG